MIPAPTTSFRADAPRWFAARSAMAFSAPMFTNGFSLPFFPVWLKDSHLDDFEIGVILALPMVVRVLVAPLVSMYADRMRERADVLIWSGILSLVSAVALFWTTSFWPIAIVYAFQGGAYAPYVPVVEAVLVTGVRRWNFDYGKMRLWGSLSFILATLGGGHLIGLWGGSVVLPCMVLGFSTTVIMGFLCPRTGQGAERSPAQKTATGRGSLWRPDLQLAMIGSSLVQASHAMLYAFSSIYWHELGYSGTGIGILWSAGVLAEVVAFFYARQLNRWFNDWTLIRFGATIAVCRWLLFPIDLGYGGYFVLQCLHAFTFAFCHVGIQRLILTVVQEEQEASAQGAYYFYNGVFMALSTLVAGFIYTRFGISSYYAMSVVAAAGLSCVIVAWYLQPQRAASGGKTSESR